MSDMAMEPHPGSPGRSYRYYTGQPTFPAFSGMSLTTFNTTLNRTLAAALTNGVVELKTGSHAPATRYVVEVTNVGTVSATRSDTTLRSPRFGSKAADPALWIPCHQPPTLTMIHSHRFNPHRYIAANPHHERSSTLTILPLNTNHPTATGPSSV